MRFRIRYFTSTRIRLRPRYSFVVNTVMRRFLPIFLALEDCPGFACADGPTGYGPGGGAEGEPCCSGANADAEPGSAENSLHDDQHRHHRGLAGGGCGWRFKREVGQSHRPSAVEFSPGVVSIDGVTQCTHSGRCGNSGRAFAPREPHLSSAGLESLAQILRQMTVEEFWEIGASGHRYSRDFVLDELENDSLRRMTMIGDPKRFSLLREDYERSVFADLHAHFQNGTRVTRRSYQLAQNWRGLEGRLPSRDVVPELTDPHIAH